MLSLPIASIRLLLINVRYRMDLVKAAAVETSLPTAFSIGSCGYTAVDNDRSR